MDREPPTILLVDDDPVTIRAMARILADVAQLRFAMDGVEALQMAREAPPDLVLLDAELPGMSGFQVCAQLQAEEGLADVPIIFVTGHSAPDFEATGFELGAADFIAKPVDPRLVLARVKAQLRAKANADALRRASTVDALTEIGNRRLFDRVLRQEWQRGLRQGDAVALLLIDVDHFKRFNDRHGHPAGDACLRAVAAALRGLSRRPADLVARYGGEEFVMLLPQTDRAGAEHVARRVLKVVQDLRVPLPDVPGGARVTVSVGIACRPAAPPTWRPSAQLGPDTPENLVATADEALYASKNAGRDRATLLCLPSPSGELAHPGVSQAEGPSPARPVAGR